MADSEPTTKPTAPRELTAETHDINAEAQSPTATAAPSAEDKLPSDPAELQALIEKQKLQLKEDEKALQEFLEAIKKGDQATIDSYLKNSPKTKGTVLDRDSFAMLNAKYGRKRKTALLNVSDMSQEQIDAEKKATLELFPDAKFEIVKDHKGAAQLAIIGHTADEMNVAFKLDYQKRVDAHKVKAAEEKLKATKAPEAPTETLSAAGRIDAAIAKLTSEEGLRPAGAEATGVTPAKPVEMPEAVRAALADTKSAAGINGASEISDAPRKPMGKAVSVENPAKGAGGRAA